MSGNDIAYHLRQNKAIDRNLFIDLLARVGRVTNISDYEYIGFGGPLLEDYKALHAALRIKRMHSIERDDNTYKRQLFNRPASFIKLHFKESDDFFRHHQFHNKGSIVWLDYTSPGELSKQLEEFRQVVSELDCFDVAKITLNAEPRNIQGKSANGITAHQARLDTLKATIPDYIPSDLTVDDLTFNRYPYVLQRFVQSSLASLSTRASGRYFHILSSFVYKDGQQMLTITGMVFNAADDPKVTEFISKSRIKRWPFANLTWNPPTQISVPALSAKERMMLDSLMPMSNRNPQKTADKLKKKLGYVPGSEALELANYAQYYRAYPHFSRVIL
jgi:hypothetical protein